ncbi:MAG: hypothetical protein KBD15_03245 [Candidatus Magasanikbacteria bacterium]|jgi:hypothetical protein|nr:hypothetical protein [Candidatus Magasanikbacteria bacterium]
MNACFAHTYIAQTKSRPLVGGALFFKETVTPRGIDMAKASATELLHQAMQAEKEGIQFAETTAQDAKYAAWHREEVARATQKDATNISTIKKTIDRMPEKSVTLDKELQKDAMAIKELEKIGVSNKDMTSALDCIQAAETFGGFSFDEILVMIERFTRQKEPLPKPDVFVQTLQERAVNRQQDAKKKPGFFQKLFRRK